MVIGLNLCPFAQRVFKADRIRYIVTEATDELALLKDLAGALGDLASAPRSRFETTLLIWNDLLEIPRRNIETLRGLGREKILEKLKAIEDGNGHPWPSHRLHV